MGNISTADDPGFQGKDARFKQELVAAKHRLAATLPDAAAVRRNRGGQLRPLLHRHSVLLQEPQ
ncbi:hypothetical protein [Streptomyces milbemycinicus]